MIDVYCDGPHADVEIMIGGVMLIVGFMDEDVRFDVETPIVPAEICARLQLHDEALFPLPSCYTR